MQLFSYIYVQKPNNPYVCMSVYMVALIPFLHIRICSFLEQAFFNFPTPSFDSFQFPIPKWHF